MPMLYVLGSRLSGWSQPSLVCRGAMPWADQRVRAGEPVGALSRDAQAPPFNAQACDIQEGKRYHKQAPNNKHDGSKTRP